MWAEAKKNLSGKGSGKAIGVLAACFVGSLLVGAANLPTATAQVPEEGLLGIGIANPLHPAVNAGCIIGDDFEKQGPSQCADSGTVGGPACYWPNNNDCNYGSFGRADKYSIWYYGPGWGSATTNGQVSLYDRPLPAGLMVWAVDFCNGAACDRKDAYFVSGSGFTVMKEGGAASGYVYW